MMQTLSITRLAFLNSTMTGQEEYVFPFLASHASDVGSFRFAREPVSRTSNFGPYPIVPVSPIVRFQSMPEKDSAKSSLMVCTTSFKRSLSLNFVQVLRTTLLLQAFFLPISCVYVFSRSLGHLAQTELCSGKQYQGGVDVYQKGCTS
jgi:hypothetical protein